MKLIIVLLYGILPLISLCQADDRQAIAGYWLSENEEYIVNIQPTDNALRGNIAWLASSTDDFGEPRRDVMNKDPRLRSRVVRGITVLDDFTYDDGKWESGKIYDFNSGQTYNGKLAIDDVGNLRVTGFYGVLFFLGRTKTWTRVADPGKYGLE